MSNLQHHETSLSRLIDIWKQLVHPDDLMERYIPYETWTKDVLQLMSTIALVVTGFISVGVIAGVTTLAESLPAYPFTLVVLAGWWWSRHGGWRWARYIPALACLGLAVYGSHISGFSSASLLYALAIVMSGMLINFKVQSLVFVISVVSLGYFGVIARGENLWSNLIYLITIIVLLLGCAVGQWYYSSRVRAILSDRVAVNQILSEEIEHGRQLKMQQHRQESQLHRLADNISDMITEITFEGVIKYASPSYSRTLGYPPELVIGMDAFALIHPDDQNVAYAAIQRVANTHQPDKVVVRGKHADGHYIWVEVTGSPIINEQGILEGLVLASRDISLQKEAELENAETQNIYRNIIESTPLGIHLYTLEEDGELIFSGYNPAADRLLNMDHSTLVGKSISQAFPELSTTDLPDICRKVGMGGETWQNHLVTNPGVQAGADYDSTIFRSAPGRVVVMFNVITDQVRNAEELRLSEEKLSKAFLTTPDAINLNRLSDGLFIEINPGFTQQTGYTWEDVKGKTSLELNLWVNPEDRVELINRTQRDGYCENLEVQFRCKDGKTIKTTLMSTRVLEINQEKCLMSITRDISDRIAAEKKIIEANSMLSRAYDATLQGWVIALELREHETADHSRRVVELTEQLAKSLGIDGDNLEQVKRGALLHDIGKMGVPDHILLKPEPLSDDEWVVMRTHPENALKMLDPIDYLKSCLDIPYCHHERWDGQGYPRGLAGEQIPLPARIFSVVDVYDALVSDRPYRKAWNQDAVLEYMLGQKGKQFDPQIVDRFLPLVYSGSRQYELKMEG